ncbi:hypothetical protein P0Y67_22765, partial [Photobacterium sp. SP02]|uniref:hypothetical protein n=1 Tax=Photobacterium sp. SP02 TaxID=3032280 RepID=UPI003144DDAC
IFVRAPDTLCWPKECPEMPTCSLVLSGSVVGAPGADNLKIRPEFFPGFVDLFSSENTSGLSLPRRR